MKRFRVVVLGASLPVALALSACGSSSSTSAGSAQVSAGNIYDGLKGASVSYFSAGSTGAFNTALQNTIMKRFDAKTGATVTVQSGQCGITQLAGEEGAGNVTYALVQFCTPSDFSLAESKGLLMKLDTSVIPVDELKPGSYDAYGFDTFQFAAGLLYNTDKFPADGKHPTTIADIFNTKEFPGKRCLSNYPQFDGVLESALLASGVPRNELYPIDMSRALKELDTIRSDTIFWSTAAQGFQDMLNGQCVMGLFPNGSAYDVVRQNPSAHLAFTMGDAISTSSPLAIPKGSPNVKAAEALMRWYILDTASQSALAEQTSYLPAVLKSSPPIPETAQAYALTGANLSKVIPEDDSYYAQNINTILKGFNAWLAG